MWRRPRAESSAWFRCPCGFEAGGDWEIVEDIHNVHSTVCPGTHAAMVDAADAARRLLHDEATDRG